MKFTAPKLITLSIFIVVLLIGVFIVSKASPYIYTKVYGNAETEKLYQAYTLAKSGSTLKSIEEFIITNNLFSVLHENDGILSLHAESKGHGETVIIWYKNGKVIDARFDEFL